MILEPSTLNAITENSLSLRGKIINKTIKTQKEREKWNQPNIEEVVKTLEDRIDHLSLELDSLIEILEEERVKITEPEYFSNSIDKTKRGVKEGRKNWHYVNFYADGHNGYETGFVCEDIEECRIKIKGSDAFAYKYTIKFNDKEASIINLKA